MMTPAEIDMAIIILTRAVLDMIAGRDPERWQKHLTAVLRETGPKEKQ